MRCNLVPFVRATLVCILLIAEGQSGYSQAQSKKIDPSELDNLFKWTSKGKDTIAIAEMPSLRGKEEMELFAQENRITNGQLTQEQFRKYFEQLNELRQKTAKDPKKIALEEKAMDEQATDIFRRHDLNEDGYWNADEIGQLKTNLTFKTEWPKWDANKDGLIDLNEFQAYYRDYSKRRNDSQAKDKLDPKGNPSQTNAKPDPKGNQSQTNAKPDPNAKENQANAKPDSKDSGRVIVIEEDDEEERPTLHYHGKKLPTGLPLWFTELDLDKDGQVSLYEWQKGGRDIEEFVQMDRNDDGLLTAEEVLKYLKKPIDLNPTPRANSQQRRIEDLTNFLSDSKVNRLLTEQIMRTQVLDLMIARSDSKSNKSQTNAKPDWKGDKSQTNAKPDPKESTKVTIIEEDDDEERPIVYRTGAKLPTGLPHWFMELDRNKDGQLSLSEWQKGGREVEEFLKMDRNDDGFLTAEEVLKYLQKPSNLNPTHHANFPKRHHEGQTKARPDSKGNKSQTSTKADPKASTKATIIEEDDDDELPIVYRTGAKLPTGLPPWFMELDRNKDGQLSLSEWQKGGREIEEFLKMDRNDDGFLTAEEVLKYLQKPSDLNPTHHANFPKRHHEGQTKANPESKLNRLLAEQIMRTQVVGQTSAKSDSKDNKSQTSAKPDPKPSAKATIIEEDDDVLPLVYHYGAKLPAGLPPWFTKLDLNKDGQLSLSEWQKGGREVEEFLKMDRNDDGHITAEEVLRYLHKPLKLNPTGLVNFQDAIDESAEDRYQGKKSFKIFTINLEKGKTYQIDLISKIFYAYLYLEDPDGKILDKNNSGGKDLISRIVHCAAETGTYRVIATSQDGHKTGAFALSVRVLSHGGGVALQGLPKWFKDLDKDADGQVTLQEWKQGGKTLDEFRKYDRNDDGLITAAEVLLYLQKPIDLNPTGLVNFQDTIEATDTKYQAKKLSKIFTIKLEKGKTYQIDHMSKAFDAYLYLEDADGNLLAEDDDSGGNLNSRIIHSAAWTGTYRLIATSLPGSRTGAFSLSVRVLGTFGGVTAKGLPAWFKDLDKDGDGQVSLHEWNQGGKKLDEFRKYDRNDDGLLTVAEVLLYLQKPIDLNPTGLVNIQDTIDEPTEDRYQGKKAFKIFTFKLEKGKTYQIDLISKVFQAYLYLEDADGNRLTQKSSVNVGANSRIVFHADKGGTYRIITTSLGGFRTGAFSLSVRVIP